MKKIIIFIVCLTLIGAYTLAQFQAGPTKTCELVQEKQRIGTQKTISVCEDIWETRDGKNVTLDKKCRNHIYTEYTMKSAEVCKRGTEVIEFNGRTLDSAKNHQVCTTYPNRIECDEGCYLLNGKRECGDGNGDGICQSGETCYTYPITNKIGKPIVKNGNLDVTYKHRDKSYLEVSE